MCARFPSTAFRLTMWTWLALLLAGSSSAQNSEWYPEHPDAQKREGVPVGEVVGPFSWESQIYPGTLRDYWVYLPAHKTQQEAEITVEFLKKNDITEFYIWLDPPQKYAVSLGLFKKLETAREKLAEVEKLALKPEMEVRFDEFTEYWVDFDHRDGQPQSKLIEDMLVKNDRMLILETKCL